jgi:hypothetical protein
MKYLAVWLGGLLAVSLAAKAGFEATKTNHLIIRENETRNVDTVQHNPAIIEKEIVLRKINVDTKHVNTTVNLVEHKYNTERKHVVEEREIPGENRDLDDCNCDN